MSRDVCVFFSGSTFTMAYLAAQDRAWIVFGAAAAATILNLGLAWIGTPKARRGP